MAQITIIADDPDEIAMAQEIALKNGVVLTVFITQHLRALLQAQIRGKYVRYVQTVATLQDLKNKLGPWQDLPEVK